MIDPVHYGGDRVMIYLGDYLPTDHRCTGDFGTRSLGGWLSATHSQVSIYDFRPEWVEAGMWISWKYAPTGGCR